MYSVGILYIRGSLRSNRMSFILSADEFANLVLEAEGMNPEREIEWFRRIRDRFIERFGEIGVSRRLRFGSLAGRL